MFLSKKKFKTGFVSEIDQFLQMLENLPGIRTEQRKAEEQQYSRIFELRDKAQTLLPDDIAWKDF